MSTCSCSTWLCSTLARSASGVVSFVGCGKTPVPRTRVIWCLRTFSMKSCSDPSAAVRFRTVISRPLRQVVMTRATVAAMSSGSQPPESTLVRLAPRKDSSIPPNVTAASTSCQGRQCQRRRATTIEQHRVHQQRAGDRDPVRRGEPFGRPEHEDEHEHAGEQRPVDPGQVDLAGLVLGGLPDPQRRQQPQLHRLPGHRERPGDHRLGRDHRGRGGQHHHRDPGPARQQQEERRGDGARVAQDERPLTEVVERQRREDEEEPGPTDRWPAEVAHVRVQRLGAGDAQHDRAERDERDERVLGNERRRVARRQPLEDLRVGHAPGSARPPR